MKTRCLLFLLAWAFMLHADVIFFRSGKITAAEISSTAPELSRIDETFSFPELPQNRLFAVISVKLDPARKLSIFDYSLESSGKTYPCVAINFSGRRFEYTERTVSASGQNLQMLFIIDDHHRQQVEPLKLKCNLPPLDGTYDLKLPFLNIGYRQLTLPGAIPATGMIAPPVK